MSICSGETIVLDAGDGYLSYLWSNGKTSQSITIDEPGEYWCTVKSLDSNSLVVNGSFSAGYLGFQSDYIVNTVSLYDEGTYAVTSNPNAVHPGFQACTDHTTGSGNMMVVNGAPVADQVVWKEIIPLSPGKEYHYSGWFTSVHPENPALLDLSINGVSIEQVSLSGVTCVWENFFEVWNSGFETEAELTIVNQNIVLAGNDFAIDDISLYEVCEITDTIVISLAPEPVVNFGADTILCEGESLLLNPGPFFSEYLWQDSSQASSFLVDQPGIYWVLVTNGQGCTGGDTIAVDFSPVPQPDLGNDTTICEGELLVLNPGGGFMTYIWQDTTSVPTYTVTEGGTYWVSVTNEFGCISSDTVNVTMVSLPSVDLGNDTSLCAGEEIVLDAGNGFLGYLWQDNSTGQTFEASQSGLYWVTVLNECFTDTDSVFLTFYPVPDVDLGNDTTICSGQSLLLQPAGNFSSYLWQDGSTFPFLTVTAAGLYTVQVQNAGGCDGSDEVFVDIASPEVNLGEDTYLCDGDTLVLDAGEGFVDYLWQDGSASNYYAVSSGGTYSVQVTDAYSCQASASVYIEQLYSPLIELGDNKTLCVGDTLVLEAPSGPYSTCYWNGQPGLSSFQVTEEGYYSLAVVNPCDSVTDEIYISVTDMPEVDLGEDRVAFPGDVIALDAGPGYETYTWQNGAHGQVMQIDENTPAPDDLLYFVEVTLGICKSSDTVRIEFFNAWVPSVITPNGDGKNDLFQPDPNRWGAVNSHRMAVYNRWGELVWESENFPEGWDGMQNGRPVADGTYFWVLELYYGNNNIKQILKGTLSIIGSKG